MRLSAEITVGLLVAYCAAFLCAGIVLGIIVGDGDPDAVSQQTPVAASSQAGPTSESSFKEEWRSPFRQVTGFDSPDGKSYTCADGLTPVQLTMGQAYKRGGTTLTLSEDTPAQSKDIPFYPVPQQVKLAVKLGAGDSMPGYIIQTNWQSRFPTINNQVTFNASLGKGEETVYTLTDAHLPYHEGDNRVVSATTCLK